MAKHYHKYKYVNLTRNPKKEPYHVYKCVLPNCSHYIRMELIDGKEAMCYKCDDIFTIREARIKKGKQIYVKLHCENCVQNSGRRTPDKVQHVDDIDKLINSLLGP